MLRIWDVEAKCSHQVISDHLGRWGQITCIKWLSDNGTGICFGTGRGLVLVYQRAKDAVSQYTYTQEWEVAHKIAGYVQGAIEYSRRPVQRTSGKYGLRQE
jgi:hypothetical protein